MSLYGSLFTAIGGLTSQSRALGHISDNVANSQTAGYKRVDTNFVSFVTRSTQRAHLPGSVVARPDYQNSVQGTIEQSENPLAMALAGGGFFAASLPGGVDPATGLPRFDDRTYYTRAGDFRMDRDGFLVNGQGYFLQGWSTDAAGDLDRTRVGPLRIEQSVFNPIATSEVDLSGNLPATLAATPPALPTVATRVQIYDSLGTLRPVDLTYTRTAPNTWTLSVSSPDEVGAPPPRTVELRFGDAGATAPPPLVTGTPDGTLAKVVNPTGGATVPTASGAGAAARVVLDMDFGQGAQPVTLGLGNYGQASGLTQYGDEFSGGATQNGVPRGSFSSVGVRESGDLVVNYDNGQTRVVARVPVVTFSDADRLQRVDGQAFLRTLESGEARLSDANANGSGKVVAGSVERSNVDVASEFTKLILAQRAYTANTRIVTTADEMLQDAINMRR